MSAEEKFLCWVGPARKEIQALPEAARQAAGRDLRRVQRGGMPVDWKPMEQVGPCACEIRIRTDQGGTVQHRVIYVAKFPEAVYVLHAFEKKSQQTPQHHLEVAGARYRQMVRERAEWSRHEGEGRMIEHVTPAGGNVFADIGFEPQEAANLLLRTDLMIEIESIIRSRGLKQRQAAALFGVSQPRISDLKRGKIDEFTIDSLVNMLGHAGVRVDLSFRAVEEPARAAAVQADAATA